MGTIEILNINKLIKKLDKIANADLTEKMNKAELWYMAKLKL